MMDPSPQIIPALYRRQQERGGYLTREDKDAVAKQLGVSPYKVESLVTFFPHFRETPPPAVEVHVCRDMSCHLRGSVGMIDSLQRWATEEHAEQIEICGVSCLGRCDRAPAAMINEQLYTARSVSELRGVIQSMAQGESVPSDCDWDLAKDHVGKWQMDVYQGRPTYEAVRRYVKEPNPFQLFGIGTESVLRESMELTPDTATECSFRTVVGESLKLRLSQRGGTGRLMYTLRDPSGRTSETEVTAETATLDWVAQAAGLWSLQIHAREGPATVRFNVDRVVDGVEGALTTAGLLGMGGAGGRAYLKWRDVFEAEGNDKFVVCNADESEPGTFKDREILLAAPHLTIEGMILAGLSVGASRGWVYIRHEYHEQVISVQKEIDRARSMGALGSNIFGSEQSFELDVFVSPGGYICGEQTALIEAMEDKRAEPRNRPPELKTNGFRDQPTLLSNVETFAWVPAIVLKTGAAGGIADVPAKPADGVEVEADVRPGEWFASQGRKAGRWFAGQEGRLKGLRLFSISGDVARPGVYEVATGITLGELIDDHCGGMAAGKQLLAAALSGPSGGLLPAEIPVQHLHPRFVKDHVPQGVSSIELRDIPLDINVARALGLMIGAGIVIYGSGADLLAEGLANSRFFANETCGKCVPCRIGSQKITDLAAQLVAGNVDSRLLPVLNQTVTQLSEVMIQTSICGLGQVASNPVRSLFRFFPELVATAVKQQGIDA